MHQSETATSPTRTRDRNEIPTRYKWNLARIHVDWAAWERDMAEVERRIDAYAALKGTLAQGAQALLHVVKLDEELDVLLGRVYRYAQLHRDTDLRDNSLSARYQQAMALHARRHTAAAWFNPELLQIPEATVRAWIDAEPELLAFRFPLLELYRLQNHVLDHAGETLLSLGGRFNQSPSAIYKELTTADIRFKKIMLSSGREESISYGRYLTTLQTCRNQEDRAAAFHAFYGVFETNINSYAAIYNAVLQRDWYLAEARRHATTLDAALEEKNVPVAVYDNLVQTVKAGAEPVRRYHRLRRKALGLERYHLYDTFLPLVEMDRRWPYDTLTDLVVESAEPLGPDYQESLRQRFAGGWVDVYENDGKRSGAYSAGVYGVGPFVLLNFNETMNDVFTLAHEMGHSMHTVLSHGAQPPATAFYTIFVAEVASTLNEALLHRTLIAREEDPRTRVALLGRQIDGILGTFCAQTLFADFERNAHLKVERGEPITAETLNALYLEPLRAFYGDAAEVDDLYEITWARISHFFESPYYVYQYATSFAASQYLVERIVQSAEARDRYLELLRAGGNDHPMEQLRKAGVDLASPETLRAVVARLDRLVGEFEREVNRL